MKRFVEVLREADKLLVLGSFLAFTVWSIWNPTASMEALPDTAEYATYIEFGVAAILFVYGIYRNEYLLYQTAHVLTAIGLFTVAGVVGFTSQSPVAVLIGGYGLAIVVSARNAARERRILRKVQEDTGPMERVNRETGGDDGRTG